MRRNAQDTADIDKRNIVNQLPTAKEKKERDRSWDKDHNPEVASYRLPVELKKCIREIAASLEVSPAEVAEYFLLYALDAYENGDLPLEPKPKITGKTLR